MNGIVLIVVSLIGFAVVLVGLGLIAIKMGVPLSALVGEDGDKSDEKGRLDVLVYERRDSLLSEAELNFYRLLVKVLAHPSDPGGSPQAVVMSKVRAADLIQVRKGIERSDWRSAFNRIKSKHVDFVLCDPVTMQAMCVIELDDSSHRGKKVQERDALMDSIYAAAGVPIVHVDCQRGYSMQEVGGLIREAVGRAT